MAHKLKSLVKIICEGPAQAPLTISIWQLLANTFYINIRASQMERGK